MDPARRGTDWLDGALAGWLIVSAAQAAGRGGAAGWLLAAVLAGAVVPYLRFFRAGWWLAAAGLVLHLATEAAGLRSIAPLLPHLLALGYLVHVRLDFFAPAGRPPADEPTAHGAPVPGGSVQAALGAIHRRIAAAGSACAVTEEEVREEAERYGVAPGAVSREGEGLYRTFLTHFLASGSLGPAEERELECVGRLLRLDSELLARVRAEAGLRGAEPVDPGVPLPAGELCLAARAVELYRVPPGSAGEEGASLQGVRPARNLAGHARAGSCRFLVTDRRLILVAPSGQQSPLPLERVAGAAAYANGVEIRPARGPALFVRFDDGVEEVARVLAGVWRTDPTRHPSSDPT